MAKPFREAPLIGADDGVGLPILRSRTTRMGELLGTLIRRFDDDFILLVAGEVGLDECIHYGRKAETLEFDLTSLQLVSLASALAACAEFRDSANKKATKPPKAKRARAG